MQTNNLLSKCIDIDNYLIQFMDIETMNTYALLSKTNYQLISNNDFYKKQKKIWTNHYRELEQLLVEYKSLQEHIKRKKQFNNVVELLLNVVYGVQLLYNTYDLKN